MFGFSIFLNETINQDYLVSMYQAGFKGMFTSIHIPEDDASVYVERLKEVGQFARTHEMEFVVDISEKALTNIGLSFDTLGNLNEAFGLTGIRADYGISNQSIALMSRQVDVMLNASTISPQDLAELTQHGADFSRIEAWHNYYPRPETGLDEILFQQLNDWLKEQGMKVMAFVPGDGQLRGPLHLGLPTLEKHRNEMPFTAALDLQHSYGIEKIFIGDPTISELTRQKFAPYIQSNTLILRGRTHLSEAKRKPLHLTNDKVWTGRMDVARDIIRDTTSRLLNGHLSIAPVKEAMSRPRGSVTVDNDLYQRYKGSIHISRRDLAADEKVNVVGQIIQEDLSLLDLIQPGQKYQIEWQNN